MHLLGRIGLKHAVRRSVGAGELPLRGSSRRGPTDEPGWPALARIAEPGERVLVIYGSGHKRLLDDFVDNAPNLSWVDPLPWLEAPPARFVGQQ